jgi:hypothetical protein
MSDYMWNMFDGRTKVNGKMFYQRLSDVLWSSKDASKFLQDLGYDGIHYIGELDGSSYVLFDDKWLPIKDHIRYKKARHGSPASFDKFDSSHMWEWEGAQAHGWGHYVAVNKNIAKNNYADRGWMPTKWYKWKDGKIISREIIDAIYDKKPYNIEEAAANTIINRMAKWYTFEEARQWWIDVREDSIKNNKLLSEADKEIDRKEIELLKWLKKKDFTEIKNRHLYELEIPDPIEKDTPTWKNYLEENWKITKKQRNEFRDAIKNLDDSKKYHFGDWTVLETIDEWTPWDNGYYLYRKLSNILGW